MVEPGQLGDRDPWVVSLAAHLGFDYLAGGHGTGGTSFGNATILPYLAVTFAMRRMVVIARSQRMSISGQNEVTGLADPPRAARGVAGGVPRAGRSA